MDAEHEYVGDTHDSGVVSIATNMLEMSVVLGMRVVGGVCEMYTCLARGGVRSE